MHSQLICPHSRCYDTLAQANNRLALVSRSNADPRLVDTVRHGSNYETGCMWVTWTRPGADADQFHFYGEVKQINMCGSIRQADQSEPQDAVSLGGIASTAEYRYMYEHKKDLAGHIWAVAVHHPDREITVAEDGRPTSLPWNLESLHEASGNAMARGKRVWNEELKAKVGVFDKFDLHYGLARYLLVPLSAGLTLAGNRPDLDIANILQQRDVNGVAQVRVERIQVQSRDTMLAMFAPKGAGAFDKPFRPIRPGREHVPHLPRVESELAALFNDAGEHQVIEEEEEEEPQEAQQLSGATAAAPSIYGVSSPPTPLKQKNPPI